MAVIVHDQTSRTGIPDRRDGFVNRIKAKYPKISIVDIQPLAAATMKVDRSGQGDHQAHPNLKGLLRR
ncbi:MAG: hypothetical protein U0Z44_12000 [Kouleothrix sp.]